MEMHCVCFIFLRMHQHGMSANWVKARCYLVCYPFVMVHFQIIHFELLPGLLELPMQLWLNFIRYTAPGSAMWQWDMKCTQELLSSCQLLLSYYG